MLSVKNGYFSYPKEKEILKNINLKLEEGKVLSVLGPNGVGKTSLIKCMIGLLKWKSGDSFIDGKNLKDIKSSDLWKIVSYIPQARQFAFSYTALEMVLIGRTPHISMFKQPSEKDVKMALEIMEKIGIIHLADKDCNQMSGGQLQMVLIARALVSDPKLIILDEPEAGLDFKNQLLILDLIKKLSINQKISVVINTHYPVNALSISDDTLMLNDDGDFIYGKTNDILIPENIKKCFNVEVVMSEIEYKARIIKDIVPVEISYKEKI